MSVAPEGALATALRRLDGRPYPAYRDLGGAWALGGGVTLWVEHVQGDPFAAPSRVRLRVPDVLASDEVADRDAREAAEDWLLRRAVAAVDAGLGARRGSGRSGVIGLYRPGPEVVERSAVRAAADGSVVVRLSAGLPAAGRRILGREAHALLLGDLVDLAAAVAPGADRAQLHAHQAAVRQQRALRRALGPAGLVAFVADGSVLPRASGVSQRPLEGAVPTRAPDTLGVTLPGRDGPVRGLGVRAGITVITGGGFHGKSTLLSAIARGHLDHVPGDGREGVVALPTAAWVRAEEGRAVTGADISAFLGNLPDGRDTRAFSTADASGSTSQAAALVEAVEAGARLLLIDEDASATNLLAADARMRAVVPADREPITPLVVRARQLVEGWGVSVVLVVGGLAAWLDVADTVIGLDRWRLADLTAAALAVRQPVPSPPGPLPAVRARRPSPAGLDAGRVRARDRRAVDLDRQELDLTAVAGVLDGHHARALGLAVRFLGAAGLVDGARTLATALDALEAILDDEGVEALSPFDAPEGDLVRPRRVDVAAALSRWRGLRLG